MKVIEICPREIGFVLWGHCQNLLDDPRMLTNVHEYDDIKRLTFHIMQNLIL